MLGLSVFSANNLSEIARRFVTGAYWCTGMRVGCIWIHTDACVCIWMHTNAQRMRMFFSLVSVYMNDVSIRHFMIPGQSDFSCEEHCCESWIHP